MKTPAILICIAACAVSGVAGYYTGHNNAAANSTTAAAGTKQNAAATGANSADATGAQKQITMSSLLKGPGLPDAEALAHWAKSLNAKDCAAAVAQLQSMPGGILRDTVLGAVIGTWAKADPKGLLGTIDHLSVPRLREVGVDAALKALAAQNPQAALQWLKDNPGTASSAAAQARYAAAIAGFAASDPKGAFDTVSALADGNPRDLALKSNAFNALTDSLAEQGRFSDATQLLGTLAAGESRDNALDHLADKWASTSPTDAATWATAVTDNTERQRLEGHVADAWAASDPLAAATWAMQTDSQTDPVAKDPNNPAAGPGTVLANAILSWSQYDLDGPGDFLNGLPASPNKDRAVAVFAMHASEEDPEGAVKWVGTITDKSIQSTVTMAVGLQMYEQDPNMFNDFVTNSPLIASDSQRQSMKQMMPMMSMASTMMKSSAGGSGDFMSNMMSSMLTGKVNPMTSGMAKAMRQRQAQGQPPPPPATFNLSP